MTDYKAVFRHRTGGNHSSRFDVCFHNMFKRWIVGGSNSEATARRSSKVLNVYSVKPNHAGQKLLRCINIYDFVRRVVVLC